MKKVKIILEADDHGYLIIILERYLEKLNEASDMKKVARILAIIEQSDETDEPRQVVEI